MDYDIVSTCCGYAVSENTDLCSKCGEHCGRVMVDDEGNETLIEG